jgi:hypothetical protein
MWVEQQGNPKRSGAAPTSYSAQPIDKLRALANPDFWLKEQATTPEIDKKLAKARGW